MIEFTSTVYIFLNDILAIFLVTYCISVWVKKGGEIRLPLIITVIFTSIVGLTATILSVGTPSKIFNVMGNISSSFSGIVLSTFMICLIALILLLQLKSNRFSKVFENVVVVLAVIFAVILIFNLVKLNLKPSRPVLYNFIAPITLIILSAMNLLYSLSLLSFEVNVLKILKPVRVVSLILVGIFYILFFIKLSFIGDVDRYIDLSLFTTSKLMILPIMAVVFWSVLFIIEFRYLKDLAKRRYYLIAIIFAITLLFIFISILNISGVYYRKIL